MSGVTVFFKRSLAGAYGSLATYRVALDDPRQELGEVPGRQRAVRAFESEPLEGGRHAARRDHGRRAGDEFDV